MSEDEKLASRIQEALEGKQGITRKRMFGGVCFLLHGNMLCGIAEGKLVARIGKEGYDEALTQNHTAPMDFTGRSLKGLIYVLPEGTKSQADVEKWVNRSLAFVEGLPRKK